VVRGKKTSFAENFPPKNACVAVRLAELPHEVGGGEFAGVTETEFEAEVGGGGAPVRAGKTRRFQSCFDSIASIFWQGPWGPAHAASCSLDEYGCSPNHRNLPGVQNVEAGPSALSRQGPRFKTRPPITKSTLPPRCLYCNNSDFKSGIAPCQSALDLNFEEVGVQQGGQGEGLNKLNMNAETGCLYSERRVQSNLALFPTVLQLEEPALPPLQQLA